MPQAPWCVNELWHTPQRPRFDSRAGIGHGELEYLFQGLAEDARNPERHLQRGRILAGLDSVDRLPGHADLGRQLLLGHLAVMEPEHPDLIDDRRLRHATCPGGSR